MEVVNEWGRKIWISSSLESTFGPFFFSNPSDSKLLLSSPSLSPPILSRIPHQTPARFLTVSGGVPPSVSSSVDSYLRNTDHNDDDAAAARVLAYNRLQFLPLPGKNSVLVFFPTGTNLDQIGFVTLSTGDSGGLRVEYDVSVAKERFFSRILKILVQPISSNWGASSNELGYVMVYSLYSIHCYCVKQDDESQQGRPALSYLGEKQFKRCSIASASWNPHLPGECLVLLEDGEMFVVDLNQRDCTSILRAFNMRVSWEGQAKNDKSCWLGCEFGSRLGVFVIARSDAVFVVRKSVANFNVKSLIEVGTSASKQEFVAFGKAGSGGFRFVVASESYVYLCDTRSVMPLLKWQHTVEKPCFIDVYSFSDLGCGESKSTTNCCLILGSFWNAQSQMFCYGSPSPSPSTSTSTSTYSSSMFVWELPQNILSPPGKCACGDCLVRDMIMMESLPESVDLQKNRLLVLGFVVLNKYLCSLEQSSGFTLIRLTSSGKLEAVKFRTSTSFEQVVGTHVQEAASNYDDANLLYFPDDDDDEYKSPKRFKYLQLDYLSSHRKGTLAGFIESRMSGKTCASDKSNSFSLVSHEEICGKLNICGFGRHKRSSSSSSSSSSSAITVVFENISSPTSVSEIALTETWSSLPIELLMLAFPNNSEFDDKKKRSLDLLVVPEFPQLPPFFLRKPSSPSSKRSSKEQPGVELVGPVLPLAVLLALPEFRNRRLTSDQDYSPDVDFSDRCSQIYEAVREMAKSDVDKTTVSVGESMCGSKRFIAYSPIRETADSTDRQHQELTTFVFKVRPRCTDNDDVGGRAGLEWFDDLCPIELCFQDRNVNFDTKALATSKTLLSQWQRGSSSYQDFLFQHHLHK